MGTGTSGLTPFIDSSVFEFTYGDMSAGERIIDSQWATSTLYVGTVMGGTQAMFGVNFADGRIKGYPAVGGPGGVDKTYYARFCRGNADYGTNSFTDNSDGTVTDSATGLMWSQADNGTGVDWEDALSYAEDSTLAGHDDWRLPNAKELHSLLDYTRSPDTTASAAIAPVFSATGSMNGVNVIDVHGAGCQRSDPKTGDPNDFPSLGHGPQGDVQRVFNHVRLVRDVTPVPEPGILTLALFGLLGIAIFAWRQRR